MYHYLSFPPNMGNDPTAYYSEEGLFTPSEVDWILLNQNQIPFETATIAADRKEENEMRKSQIKWLRYDQYPDFFWVYNRLQTAIERANSTFWNFNLYSMPEHIQYTEYYAGGGHYDWHMDIGPQELSTRKVSITVQLSHPDEYKGGDLELFRSPNPEKAPRGYGSVVVFPSYMMHRVTKVTEGARKSLVLWVGGESYK